MTCYKGARINHARSAARRRIWLAPVRLYPFCSGIAAPALLTVALIGGVLGVAPSAVAQQDPQPIRGAQAIQQSEQTDVSVIIAPDIAQFGPLALEALQQANRRQTAPPEPARPPLDPAVFAPAVSALLRNDPVYRAALAAAMAERRAQRDHAVQRQVYSALLGDLMRESAQAHVALQTDGVFDAAAAQARARVARRLSQGLRDVGATQAATQATLAAVDETRLVALFIAPPGPRLGDGPNPAALAAEALSESAAPPQEAVSPTAPSEDRVDAPLEAVADAAQDAPDPAAVVRLSDRSSDLIDRTGAALGAEEAPEEQPVDTAETQPVVETAVVEGPISQQPRPPLLRGARRPARAAAAPELDAEGTVTFEVAQAPAPAQRPTGPRPPRLRPRRRRPSAPEQPAPQPQPRQFAAAPEETATPQTPPARPARPASLAAASSPTRSPTPPVAAPASIASVASVASVASAAPPAPQPLDTAPGGAASASAAAASIRTEPPTVTPVVIEEPLEEPIALFRSIIEEGESARFALENNLSTSLDAARRRQAVAEQLIETFTTLRESALARQARLFYESEGRRIRLITNRAAQPAAGVAIPSNPQIAPPQASIFSTPGAIPAPQAAPQVTPQAAPTAPSPVLNPAPDAIPTPSPPETLERFFDLPPADRDAQLQPPAGSLETRAASLQETLDTPEDVGVERRLEAEARRRAARQNSEGVAVVMAAAAAPSAEGPLLTELELRGVLAALSDCWSMSPQESATMAGASAALSMNLTETGFVDVGSIRVTSSSAPQGVSTAPLIAAARAVLSNQACQPFGLPPEKRQSWRRMVVMFDMRTRS